MAFEFYDVVQPLFASVKAVPVDGVSAASVANIGRASAGEAAKDLSIIGLFMQADLVVKGVMLFLLFCSVWSWAIIFDKWVLIKGVWSRTKDFEKAFWSGQPLEGLYERIKGRETHPIALVFAAAMEEWTSRDTKELSHNTQLRVGTKERIFQAMQVATNRAMDSIEYRLGFLATVGSAAPFIGLFGTVWGIMTSFQAIAVSKNTSLAVVAPGIAEALLATAFGLAAAIPAVIFYNKFASDISRLATSLEDFSSELGSIMSKELDS